MTCTVIGPVVTSEGLVHTADALGRVDGVAWVPSAAYLRDQPADLGVHFNHDTSWRLGRVAYLERDRHGIMAVAQLDADVHDLLADAGPWYFSDAITCRRYGDAHERSAALLTELSLVRRTGNQGTKPIVVVPGDIGTGSTSMPRSMPMAWDACWTRAADAIPRQRYRRAQHTTIVDADPLDAVGEALTAGASPAAAALIRARSTEQSTPSGPTVRWYGQELGGEVARRLIDAIEAVA